MKEAHKGIAMNTKEFEAKMREWETRKAKDGQKNTTEQTVTPSSPDNKTDIPETQYFLCDLQNYSFKDDIATMEAPIFSLSTQKEDQKIWIWQSADGKKSVEVKPSFFGRATVFDKDVLIFAASQLMAAIDRGDSPTKTIRFKASDYFKSTHRDGSGRSYERFRTSLERLSGTRITTNIKTGNKLISSGFGIIDKWRVVDNGNDKNEMTAIEVTLSDWIYNAILSGELLTISPDYFNLRKPLARRLYEIARKHVGKQISWSINIEMLKDKCGVTRETRKFRADIKELQEYKSIPDYNFILDENDIVIFKPLQL